MKMSWRDIGDFCQAVIGFMVRGVIEKGFKPMSDSSKVSQMKLLVVGGAGFVGSSLARSFAEETSQNQVVVMDNLHRRGSELNLPDFRRRGISFHHGDIRIGSDFDGLGTGFDLVIDASAEPSVQAGLNEAPHYLLQTNLQGTVHCLEFARKHGARFLFLSTSRVYSIEPLQNVGLREEKTRLALTDGQKTPGVSPAGIAESFPVHLPRSLYGASKLASELLIQEYAFSYGTPALINRCGVIAGPGQFGKVDQGVFTLWVAHHFFGKPLSYTGFGGEGKQVRDLLHPSDLFQLIRKQIRSEDAWKAEAFNVGGGIQSSLSLCELTQLCREMAEKTVPIESRRETHRVDVPYYVSDSTRARERFNWAPKRPVQGLIYDIFQWLKQNQNELKWIFN
jgi:CDP-paratose 2-epimerase